MLTFTQNNHMSLRRRNRQFFLGGTPIGDRRGEVVYQKSVKNVEKLPCTLSPKKSWFRVKMAILQRPFERTPLLCYIPLY